MSLSLMLVFFLDPTGYSGSDTHMITYDYDNSDEEQQNQETHPKQQAPRRGT